MTPTCPARIGMIANFQLTETLLAVATQLHESWGCEVHWFVVSRRWERWLRRNGVTPDRIVSLHLAPPLNATLASPPKPGPGEPDIDYLIRSDRVLGARDPEQARRQLLGIADLFGEELARRSVEVVFGEATWAYEVLLSYVASAQGVPYLAPTSTRIPSGRLAFAPAPTHARIISLDAAASEASPPSAAELYDAFLSRKSGQLWSHNQFSAARYLRQPKLWIEKIFDALFDSRGNPTQHTLLSYLRNKNPFRLARNTQKLRAFMDSHALASPSELSSPYLLLSLHVQPEASIDIIAWQASDQLQNIRALSRVVGDDVVIAVKEHSHRFGYRDVHFFEELTSLPNIVFVDPLADARSWMEGASAVVTPSGTMALENALEGRRSALLAPMWFADLPSAQVFSPQDPSGITRFLTTPLPEDPRADGIAHLTEAVSRSRPGIFATEGDIPGVLSEENVHNLAEAFFAAITQTRS